MNSQIRSYRAAWVVPVGREPIRDGVVAVQDGLIVSVEKYQADHHTNSLLDVGQAAIIPGLINAHTHLEFSHLRQPLGSSGIAFTDWIRLIVTSRNQANPVQKSAVIRQGLLESFEAGVWCVGDIATSPISVDQYLGNVGEPDQQDCQFTTQICKVVFHEQLGRNPNQFAEKLEQVESFLALSSEAEFYRGVSPHSPYSVHPELLKSLCSLSSQANCPVAMHLAETTEERELLERQSGPFVELLKEFGVWDQASFIPTFSIMEILRILVSTPRALIIHGNYLNDSEIEYIGNVRGRMSVVFCPRTHDYFGHVPYPLEKMIKSGICLAIGTDSRASNPNLDLFQDLKFLARAFPHLGHEEVLRFGTINGATALGFARQLGSLEVGKQAAISVVRLKDEIRMQGKPNQWLFDDDAVCRPITN